MDILPQTIAPLAQPLSRYIDVLRRAGRAIMPYYKTDIEVATKGDGSPVTKADLASNAIILEAFRNYDPNIPIVSEENGEDENKQLIGGDLFWLVDPLDGTKEFLKQSDEFTIGIALIESGIPVFGMIYAPATGMTYVGGKNYGSFSIAPDDVVSKLKASSERQNVIIASRSHHEPETARYIAENFADARIESIGSQLKAVAIAEGRADAFPRMGSGLHAWDLAPQHAFLEGAGGRVTRPDGSAITYQDESLLAGDFIAASPAI